MNFFIPKKTKIKPNTEAARIAIRDWREIEFGFGETVMSSSVDVIVLASTSFKTA